MKIVYAGSPEYAVAPLRALLDAGKEVIAVITQPDRPVGRKKILTPTPVKAFAAEKGLPVCDFVKIRDHAKEIKSFGADLLITCAYGQLLTQDILDSFKIGVYNLHASLLPLFRGASPIQSAILSGCDYTGVTVMKTELALDSGGILLVKRTEIGNRTCGELSAELSELSAQAALEAVKILESGEENLLIQDEAAATYCKKIVKSDARIDFTQPNERVARLINAMSPSPAAFCYFGRTPVNMLKADTCGGCGKAGAVLAVEKSGVILACGSGAVRVSSMQFAGGKALTAAEIFNGRRIKAGDGFD